MRPGACEDGVTREGAAAREGVGGTHEVALRIASRAEAARRPAGDHETRRLGRMHRHAWPHHLARHPVVHLLHLGLACQ